MLSIDHLWKVEVWCVGCYQQCVPVVAILTAWSLCIYMRMGYKVTAARDEHRVVASVLVVGRW